jgi:cell division protease FtsH
LGRDISRNKKHSDKTAEIIDEEIKNIITAAKEKAEKILKDNMDKLKYMVEMLIEREFLTGEEVDIIMKGEKLQAKQDIQENKTETQQEKEAAKAVEETVVVETAEAKQKAEKKVTGHSKQKVGNFFDSLISKAKDWMSDDVE